MSDQKAETVKESAEGEFVSVKTRSRKRKLVQDVDSKSTEMDTDQPSEVKKPHFPPISGDQLKVMPYKICFILEDLCLLIDLLIKKKNKQKC